MDIIRLSALFAILLATSACQPSSDNNSESPSNAGYEFYMPITKEYADTRFFDLNQITDMQLVHHDGFGNSEKDIADINNIFMYRNTNGDIFVAYDAFIISYGLTLDDPTVWGGSAQFSLYIDTDNNPETGNPIGDIGSDVMLDGLRQSVWNSTTNSWESTWFESVPPLVGHSIGPLFFTTSYSFTYDQAYVRAGIRYPYLDTLTLDPKARAVLQITHDIFDIWSGAYVTESIDTSKSFEIGSI